MSTLTQFFPKSSESPIGEIRMVATGMYNAPLVIDAADGSVWLRDNALYPRSEYPEAAKLFYGTGGAYTFTSIYSSGSQPTYCAYGNNKVLFAAAINNFSSVFRSSSAVGSAGINTLESATVSGSADAPVFATFGSGRFILCGNGAGGVAATVATSTDLITWSRSGPFSSLLGIPVSSAAGGSGIYLAGLNYAINTGENLARSTNGTTWSVINSQRQSGLVALGYGDNKFISITRYGQVETSTDGLSWTGPNLVNASGASGDRYWNQVAYANGVYVAVGDNNSASPRGLVMTSTDGEYWTNRTTGLNLVFYTVTYGAGTWIAGSSSGWIAKSTDAVTWTTQTVGASFTINTIIYTDKFIAGGSSGNLRTSTDGVTWTARTLPNGGQDVNALAYSAADNRVVYVGGAGRTAYSTDGITWTDNYAGSAWVGEPMSKMVYGNGLFLASGANQRLMKSTNGIAWSKCMPITPNNQNISYTPILAYNSTNQLFGAHFVDSPGGIHIWTSTDGNTWADLSDESGIMFPQQGAGRLFGFSAANDKFMGITDWNLGGGIYQTADGVTWNHLPFIYSSTQMYKTVTYGNGQWVVGGAYGNIWTSTDTRTWVSRGPILENNYQSSDIESIAYNENSGLFVCAGTRMLACSTDAITWEPLAQNIGQTSNRYSDYTSVCAADAKAFYLGGRTIDTTLTYGFYGYSVDPTVPYSPNYDATENFYIPLITNSTLTVGTTLTGTQNSGQFITTYNGAATAYVKGK